MTFTLPYRWPYTPNKKYDKSVAYFSMEFALDQPLKIYSGGLGFLAGSHMRSAYELKQAVVGIGILWKYGYYNQIRKPDKSMDVLFQEKIYSFLEDTGLRFEIMVNNHLVNVMAWYLPPETFGTTPIFLLSTDLPENDYLAQTITHKLYDSNLATRTAQYILLGQGGSRLLELLEIDPEVYHLNEAHALPSAFFLYQKYKDVKQVKKRLVLTTHTPEAAGNDVHELSLLKKMGYFNGLSLDTVKEISDIKDDNFNHTLVALRLARKANGVSKKHGEVARNMWNDHKGVCPIISITNAQNKKYWADHKLSHILDNPNGKDLQKRKLKLKKKFFEIIADQTGKLFDPEVLTIVWARRFAEYKRPALITSDEERFHALMTNKDRPIQIIWAGKPFPMDYASVGIFDHLVHLCKDYMNSAILVGYELWLSRMCKRGADLWLNNPRVPREASGTSGMTAAMNGAVNFSTSDGWVLEFIRHGHNGFLIPMADADLPNHEQDQIDGQNMMDILESEIIPCYYETPDKWKQISRNGMEEVAPNFDSDRMADEYYHKLYSQ